MTYISVIVPVYNAEKTIRSLLRSLNSQETTFDYEVILVDNESDDKTSYIIEKAKPECTFPLKVISQPRGVSISAVRNFGVEHSAGTILAFIDSDCIPPKNWLHNGIDLLGKNKSNVLVAGNCRPPKQANWIVKAWNSTRAGHKDKSVFVHGANLLISRSAFYDVGGFREDIETSEDYDLGKRVSMKYKIIHAPDLSVIHHGEPQTLFEKFKKERWYSKNIWQTLYDDFSYKPFWLSFLFMLNAGIFIYSIILFKFTFTIVSFLIAILMIISLAGFFCLRARNFKYFLHLIPISFAYISGRTAGIIDGIMNYLRFKNRNEKFLAKEKKSAQKSSFI